MKNKSKLKKIKQNKQTISPSVPAEWLYLNRDELSFASLKEAFRDQETISVQIWEEAGVAELELAEAKSIDLEKTEPDLGDNYSNSFLNEHGTKTLFLVTIAPEEFDKVKPVMELMIDRLGGMFCGDTDDFTPIITK